MSSSKHDFEYYIELMFQRMVDYTEPICQLIDASLAQMLTFDTSGIELYVTENNPKTLNSLIKRLKAYYKDKSVGDASALTPVLKDFFALHPDFHPDTFLGDSAFDSADLYGILINDFYFSKAQIPYNPGNESSRLQCLRLSHMSK